MTPSDSAPPAPSPVRWLALSEITAAHGGKACGLARAAALAFRVPATVVLPAEAALLPDPALAALVRDALSGLGVAPATPIAVRSSSRAEDLGRGAAAGVFRTERGVRGVEAVCAAVRRVFASQADERAVAYGRRNQLSAEQLAMAVILQPDLDPPGDARSAAARVAQHGVCFSRDPSAPDSPWLRIETHPDGSTEAWLVDRATRTVALSPQSAAGERTAAAETLDDTDTVAIAGLALQLEAQLGTAVDIEWLIEAHDRRPWLLQVRPITAFGTHGGFPLTPSSFGPEPWACDATWQLDAEHNPDPLSPAQAGLVALVDAQTRTGVRQRVVEGYLYWTREGAEAAPIALTLEELGPYYERELAPQVESLLAPFETLGVDSWPPLPQALDVYVRLYELRSSLSSAVGRARKQARSRGLKAPRRGAPIVPSRESIDDGSDGARTTLWEQYGAFSRVWDVMVPTFGELAEARSETSATGIWASAPTGDEASDLTSAGAPDPTERLLLQAMALGELDDVTLARLQRLVRRALLGVAATLGHGLLATPEDIFFLPLAAVADHARRGARLPADTAAQAALARQVWSAQRERVPPARVRGMVMDWDSQAGLPGRSVLRGVGLGGRARGRALLATRAALPGEIPIRATLLPSDALLLGSPSALVAEHGGALSHGAILARERGLPAVVGVRGARTAIPEGAELVVDGVAGEVYLV